MRHAPPRQVRAAPSPESRTRYAVRELPSTWSSAATSICAQSAQAWCRRLSDALWLQRHGVDAWEAPLALTRQRGHPRDLVTAVSRYTRRHACEWADIARTRVRVLPNTVERRFARTRQSASRRQDSELRGRPILRTAARWRQRAVQGPGSRDRRDARVLVATPSRRLCRCGDGRDAGRRLLAKRSPEAGVAVRGVGLVGSVAHEDLPDYYRPADALVHAEHRRGLRHRCSRGGGRATCPVVAGDRRQRRRARRRRDRRRSIRGMLSSQRPSSPLSKPRRGSAQSAVARFAMQEFRSIMSTSCRKSPTCLSGRSTRFNSGRRSSPRATKVC